MILFTITFYGNSIHYLEILNASVITWSFDLTHILSSFQKVDFQTNK